jgi:hypothetical protein
MLAKAEEYEAYLRAALQAKGVGAPQLPSSAELGWTGDLPHPMAYQYPGSSDIELLRHQAKQVGAALFLALALFRAGQVQLQVEHAASGLLAVLHEPAAAPGQAGRCSVCSILLVSTLACLFAGQVLLQVDKVVGFAGLLLCRTRPAAGRSLLLLAGLGCMLRTTAGKC